MRGIDGEDGFVLGEGPGRVGLVLRHQEVGVSHAGDRVAREGRDEGVKKGAGLGLTPEFAEGLGQLQPGLNALGRELLGAGERRQGALVAPLPQVDFPERERGLVVQGIAPDEGFEDVGRRVQPAGRSVLAGLFVALGTLGGKGRLGGAAQPSGERDTEARGRLWQWIHFAAHSVRIEGGVGEWPRPEAVDSPRVVRYTFAE